MKETTLSGWAFALRRLDVAVGPFTWELLLIDGQVDGEGQIQPGSGTGEVIHLMLDSRAAATLHEQSREAAAIRVADSLPPVMVPPRSRNRH